MGRTIPSFRIALEQEISSWRHYKKTLSRGSKKVLEQVFNSARNQTSSSSLAARPVRFEGLFMGIIHSHEKRLFKIRNEMEQLRLVMKDDRK